MERSSRVGRGNVPPQTGGAAAKGTRQAVGKAADGRVVQAKFGELTKKYKALSDNWLKVDNEFRNVLKGDALNKKQLSSLVIKHKEIQDTQKEVLNLRVQFNKSRSNDEKSEICEKLEVTLMVLKNETQAYADVIHEVQGQGAVSKKEDKVFEKEELNVMEYEGRAFTQETLPEIKDRQLEEEEEAWEVQEQRIKDEEKEFMKEVYAKLDDAELRKLVSEELEKEKPSKAKTPEEERP